MAEGHPLRRLWQVGDVALGGWCTIPNSFSAEIMAATGFDYVCIDLQHGPIDDGALLPMLQAAERHRGTTLVRVAANEPWLIGRALDIGASGVIVPFVESAEEAARAAAACRFLPVGTRSFGPLRASVAKGTAEASTHEDVVCIAMIESVAGMKAAEAIAGTPGIDAVYIGPADLARSDQESAVDHLIEVIREAAATAGTPCGIHCRSGDEARARLDEGFVMATVATDHSLLATAARAHLRQAAGEKIAG